MKTCYVDTTSRSIVDLCDYYGKGLIITRVNVPHERRGQGHGRALMQRVCAAADATRTTLYLEILPSGGLDYDQLEAWYSRLGFIHHLGIYRRRPR